MSRSKRTVTAKKAFDEPIPQRPQLKKLESDEQTSPIQQKYLKMEQFFTSLRADRQQALKKVNYERVQKNIIRVTDANIMKLKLSGQSAEEGEMVDEQQNMGNGINKPGNKQQQGFDNDKK